jgi:hypothetical protein
MSDMNKRPTPAELAANLRDAAVHPKNWDVPGLLVDAANAIELQPGWTSAEVDNSQAPFVPLVRWRALSRQVLAVARTRVEGKWSAYCDAVRGEDHDAEAEDMVRRGQASKLPHDVAIVLFPEFREVPYAK